MNAIHSALTPLALVVALGATTSADNRALRARLAGPHEVPAVISAAHGDFSAKVDDDAQTIEYELSYEGLEGGVLQSHIHVGQRTAAGGIMIWLCSNLASPPTPPGTQPCPAPPATIQGTITAANVVGPTTQGVNAGNFADAIAAIRGGLAYVNVHSSVSPGGEIRGQIK